MKKISMTPVRRPDRLEVCEADYAILVVSAPLCRAVLFAKNMAERAPVALREPCKSGPFLHLGPLPAGMACLYKVNGRLLRLDGFRLEPFEERTAPPEPSLGNVYNDYVIVGMKGDLLPDGLLRPAEDWRPAGKAAEFLMEDRRAVPSCFLPAIWEVLTNEGKDSTMEDDGRGARART